MKKTRKLSEKEINFIKKLSPLRHSLPRRALAWRATRLGELIFLHSVFQSYGKAFALTSGRFVLFGFKIEGC